MNFETDHIYDVVTAYDAFISYSSREQQTVERISRRLDDCGIRIWKDDWELIGGEKWIDRLPEAIAGSKVFVAFVGENGLGPWHKEEIDIALSRAVREKSFRVIPVAIGGAPNNIKFPAYLDSRHSIDLRDESTWGFYLLKCSILGRSPGRKDKVATNNDEGGRLKIMRTKIIQKAFGYGVTLTTYNPMKNNTLILSGAMVRIHKNAAHPITNTVPVFAAPIGRTKVKENLQVFRNKLGRYWRPIVPEHYLKPKEVEDIYFDLDVTIGTRGIVSIGIFWHNANDRLWRLEEFGYFAIGCRGGDGGRVTNHDPSTYTPGQRNTDDPILLKTPEWPSRWPEDISVLDLQQYDANESGFVD